MHFANARVTLLILILLAAGCERKPAQTDAPAQAPRAGDENGTTDGAAADIDRLRQLPYAGFTDEDDDDDAGDGVIRIDRDRVAAGVTLLSIFSQSRAELIDEEGKLLQAWQHHPSRHWDAVTLLPSGDLITVGADPTPPGVFGIVDELRYILRLDWGGETVWKHTIPAHHDIQPVPDGGFVTLTFARREIPEVSTEADTRDDQVTLLDDAGEIVDSMSLYDAIQAAPEIFPLQAVQAAAFGGRVWVDLFHCNAVDWMRHEHLFERDPIYARDNVLVTFRHQDRVAIFNWTRKAVVWAWGEGELDGPHDARVLENGNILVFDNGLGRGWSRVVELDPLRREIVWEHTAPEPKHFYTRSKGSNQRLANGNTLVANSDNGQVFETTHEGEIVWDYRSTFRDIQGRRATIFNARRYPHAMIERIVEANRESHEP